MKQLFKHFVLVAISLFVAAAATAQVTTSSMSGKITDEKGEPVPGVVVSALHTPSGTQFYSTTDARGFYRISNMRVGGPYIIEISSLGFGQVKYEGITLNLSENKVFNAKLTEEAVSLDEIKVVADRDRTSAGDQAGANTSIDRAVINTLPNISRSVSDIMKLTPQAYDSGNGPQIGGGTFRQNYFTVDGAAFNNAFGIGGSMPANGSPISLDAIEQISVSLTPYDVRQSGFLGASMNAVTRSGSNDFQASVYSYFYNENFRGNKVGDVELTRSPQTNLVYGARVGGPIIKDKLFFFVNFEGEYIEQPGPSKVAATAENPYTDGSDNVARPLASDMNELSKYLSDKYGYVTGPYQGYSNLSPSYKFLARLDWNINKNHRFNIRYSYTESKSPTGPSSSTTGLSDRYHLGGSRTSMDALYFQNSGYFQEKNFSSIAAELNSSFLGGKLTNILRATYSHQYEPRTTEGGQLPFVDIGMDGKYYTSFGTELFSLGNLRDVSTVLVTDELTAALGMHNLTFGLQYEYDNTKNGFQRFGAGYFQYDSLEDFYNDKPHQFAITHSYADGYAQVYPEFDFNQFSIYLQDEMTLSDRFKLMAGIRFEIPFYPALNTFNQQVADATLADVNGSNGKYDTSTLPSTKFMVSPRIGFNWDIKGDRSIVMRGGSGWFTGRIPFVWIVAQAGDSGVLQKTVAFKEGDGDIPAFSANRNEILNALYPNGIDGDPAATRIETCTLMDKTLKLPQTWKSSLGFDFQIPGGFIASIEGIYNYDINPTTVKDVTYKPGKMSEIPGYADNRLVWGEKYETINGLTKGAYLLTNAKEHGWYYSVTAKLEKTYWKGLSGMIAYTYSNGKSLNDGWGDQVGSSYQSASTINGSNIEELGWAQYVMPHRLIASVSYRKEYARNFATSVSLFYEGGPQSRMSYTYTSAVVGDYGGKNLIYVPKTKDELYFSDVTEKNGGVTEVVYSAEDQRNDFWNYVNNDKYLKTRKGQYAERNAIITPWSHQFDIRINQDFFVTCKNGNRNTLQLGLDILNVGNLLNKNWGHKFYINENEILKQVGTVENGIPVYQFQKNGNNVLKETFSSSTSFSSTWMMQVSLRWIFN